MSRNYRTKLRKEIKITHDKVSKNIVNRLVSCLDNRETEKQDRALQEAPRAYRASTEARGSSSTEDRSRSKRNDGGRRAPTRRSFSALSCLSLASATITAA